MEPWLCPEMPISIIWVVSKNDLVPDIDDDHDIQWVDIIPDTFTQNLLNVPDDCQ